MRYPAFICAILLSSSAAQAFETKAKQAILVDDMTHTVLYEVDADAKMYPSSMSKLMTLYVLFDKLKQGAIKLDSTFPVSEKAWKKGGSKMFVRVNTDVAVEDLIRGIVVQSGNDACIVVAEALGGSEDGFAKLMNDKAKQLGLKGSHFANSTGWPDEQHFMNARDLATLTQALIRDFPDYYPYFAEESFTYNGITQPNRNRLLDKGIGVDGLKTGHTEAAGYGIAVSAKEPEGPRRVVAVVNGLESDKDRIAEARKLVEYGFREFEVTSLRQAGGKVTQLPVWLGADEWVDITVADELLATLPRDTGDISFWLKTNAPVAAPVAQGKTLALLEIRRGDLVLQTVPLIAANEVQEASFFNAMFTKAGMILGL